MVLQYTLFDCINNINHFYTLQLQVITDSYSVCYICMSWRMLIIAVPAPVVQTGSLVIYACILFSAHIFKYKTLAKYFH